MSSVGEQLIIKHGNLFLNATRKYYTGVTVTTNTDVYTCPAGKKAVLGAMAHFSNASSGTVEMYYRIGGVNLLCTTTSHTGTNFAQKLNNASVYAHLEAGDTLRVHRSSGTGYVNFYVIEYDAASPIVMVAKTAGWSSGNNIVYTCPAGKVALLTDLRTPNAFTALDYQGSYYLNASGTTRSVYANVVKSGESPDDTKNRIVPAQSVANGALSTGLTVANAGGSILEAGDYLSVNTDGNGNQYFYATVIELDTNHIQ